MLYFIISVQQVACYNGSRRKIILLKRVFRKKLTEYLTLLPNEDTFYSYRG
jgi:hypothetical protein